MGNSDAVMVRCLAGAAREFEHRENGDSTMTVLSVKRRELAALRERPPAGNGVPMVNGSANGTACVKHLLAPDPASPPRSLPGVPGEISEQPLSPCTFQNMISKNPRMRTVFELIGKVAQTATTVLIEGETGTGKELVARAIHQTSPARAGPLVAMSCAAAPESLLESELFGHEKGAFTGAASSRRGRFELANGGTLFLDEIGDVPASMQAKLLRVLEERRFERVGGSESIEVDVRVIAATNRSLRRLVKIGRFRKDLYYRLNVVKFHLPPLRERPEDIPMLAAHFVQKYARSGEPPKQLAPEVMEALFNHHWPGNIRELENAIERACIMSHDKTIQLDNLSPEITEPGLSKPVYPVNLDRSLPELLREAIVGIEQQYIRMALKKTHGQVGRCAEVCGMSRRAISAKIAEYKLDKSLFKWD